VETRECRLIFLWKRPAKRNARKLKAKPQPIPETGIRTNVWRGRPRPRNVEAFVGRARLQEPALSAAEGCRQSQKFDPGPAEPALSEAEGHQPSERCLKPLTPPTPSFPQSVRPRSLRQARARISICPTKASWKGTASAVPPKPEIRFRPRRACPERSRRGPTLRTMPKILDSPNSPQ